MHYRFRASGSFELAKACLAAARGMPAPGTPASSLPHYGRQFRWLKPAGIRAKGGPRLRTASPPLATRSPEFMRRLRAASSRHTPLPPDLTARSVEQALPTERRPAEGRPVDRRPIGSRDPVLPPDARKHSARQSAPLPADALAAMAAAGFDDEPLPSAKRRLLPTALLASVLGIAAAIAIGMAIGRSGGFRLKTPEAPSMVAAAAPQVAAPSAGNMLSAGSGSAGGQSDTAAAGAAPDSAAPQSAGRTVAGESPSTRQLAAIAPPAQAGTDGTAATGASPAAAMPAAEPKQELKPASRLQQPDTSAGTKKTGGKKRKARASQLADNAAGDQPAKTVTVKKKRKKPAPPTQSPEPFSDDSPAYTAQAPRPMHVRLAQCERIGSVIARERCKWRLCNRQWGRNGCPSYNNRAGPVPILGASLGTQRVSAPPRQ